MPRIILEKSQSRMAAMLICLAALLLTGRLSLLVHAQRLPDLKVTASFASKDWITAAHLIGLRLSRPIEVSDGSLAVFIDHTDITNLFTSSTKGLKYSPRALQLPRGEHNLVVYLVTAVNDWKEIARFPMRVKDSKLDNQDSNPANDLTKRGFNRFEIKPSLGLNLKSESTVLFFPETTRPERINFVDFDLQGTLQATLARGDFNYQNQFDFVGTTSQNRALRFGEKGANAPQIDLSSYLMQFQAKKIKVLFGHHAYGTNRYFMDNFSSRGINVDVPLGSRFDFSFNATNGTSVVGWNNFSGLSQRKHNIIAATVGSEFFPKHPGWFRLEVGILRGSLLPLNNVNQRNLNDAETSHGRGARLVATDSKERLRLDVGYGRSRFGNPSDPLLNQSFSVVPVRETSRNANYVDFRYHLLKELGLIKDHKINLTFAFRHNRVEPLFRSVAVYTQADRLDNQYELTGSLGEITAGVVHNRLNDNLDDVPSILKTLTRRSGFSLGLPLTSLFGTTHSFSRWLPRLSYNSERTHAFGAFLPTNSGFSDSHVPDQASINQTFNAEWAHNDLRFGYRFNKSSQDNRQVGREAADFRTLVNALTFGVKPFRRLELNFDLSSEHASNLEVNRLDRALRLAFGSNFQTTKKSMFAANVSSNLSSDNANISKNRSIDLDVQWSWRFGVERSSYRKLQGQFFIKYANRFARAQDNLFLFTNLTKFQALSGGLSVSFF